MEGKFVFYWNRLVLAGKVGFRRKTLFWQGMRKKNYFYINNTIISLSLEGKLKRFLLMIHLPSHDQEI